MSSSPATACLSFARFPLVDAIIQSNPEAIVCAAKIEYLLEMGLNTTLTRYEVAYLALHVARLATDVKVPG